MEGGVVRCPGCQAEVAAGERFCTVCGADGTAPRVFSSVPPAGPGPSELYALHDPARGERAKKIGAARKWLFALSVLTLLAGIAMYFVGKQKVEEEIATAQQQTAEIAPEERDRLMKQEVGMTFQEAIDHDRGQVTMLLVINLGLAALYFALALWSRRNPLTASVVALLLFLTVTIASGVIEPKSLAQGAIVKIFVILALSKAITAASAERKLAATA